MKISYSIVLILALRSFAVSKVPESVTQFQIRDREYAKRISGIPFHKPGAGKNGWWYPIIFIFTSVFISFSSEAKRGGNRPYVQSSDGGSFYGRCIPDESKGNKGTTKIFRVRKDADELLDQYDWYNRGRVRLGWSPTAGKVAVMRLRQEEYKEPEKQIELSFYLGGELLKSYTTLDLINLGARLTNTADGGRYASYKSMDCQQVPNTNDYYFGIELENGSIFKFNVLNGKLCRIGEKKRTQTIAGHTITYTEYKLIDIEVEPPLTPNMGTRKKG